MTDRQADRRRRRTARTPGLETLEGRLLLSRPAALPRGEVAIVHPDRTGAHQARTGQAIAARPAGRWGWLEGTFWCVPTANLPALVFGTEGRALVPVSDQTVFQITGSRGGYFWGVTVAQLGSSSKSTMAMVGSVTPEGRVLLNFTSADGSSDPVITQGIGQMRWRRGQWTMENQMFTGTGDGPQVGHWAYMVQTRPGRPTWRSLPGVGVSVPDFVGDAAKLAPRPVTPVVAATGG